MLPSEKTIAETFGQFTGEAPRARGWRGWAALAWLVLAIVWGAWIRADTALADPNFDAHDARGMLRSDPALLHYLAEELWVSARAGRITPADFRADPRIQHPFVTDVPAEFPVGQEFLTAWTKLLLDRLRAEPVPLHVAALLAMALMASLFVAGVFVGVRALTGSELWASLAVFLALVTPANYRTIGFLLVGEDMALPLWVLHLGFLARYSRSGRSVDLQRIGWYAAAALATWHAASFVLTLELGVILCWTLLVGRSPFEARWSWTALMPVFLAGGCVPVLRASGFLVSPAAALALALLVPGLVRRQRSLGPRGVRLTCVATLVLALLLFAPLAPDSYAHVHEVVLAKLRFLGRFPDDPNRISFDARLLWQGPFETLPLRDLVAWCGWPLVVLFGLACARARGAGAVERCLLGLALLAVPVAWMFSRLAVLPGLLVPPLAALALARSPRRRLALGTFALLCLLQAGRFADFVGEHRIEWYLPAPARAELTRLVEFVRANVPESEPITGDFVNSTALLAHTRRPIVLQPKYETDRSRRQAEAFLTTFFQRSPEELATLLAERFRCRYLLVDRYVLWELSRATAGMRVDERAPRPGTAAERFLSLDEAVLADVPGFELVYRGTPGVAGADYRLYRCRDPLRAR
jgi:hypothetical protein